MIFELNYCQENTDKLKFVGIDPMIWQTEKIFIEFVTRGTVNGRNEGLVAIDKLEDKEFWVLHDFITTYFDMDAALFDDFQALRSGR